MTTRLLLIPLILVTTSALADAIAVSADAQTHAAALLRGTHEPGVIRPETPDRRSTSALVALDAQASAAALLSGSRRSPPSASAAADGRFAQKVPAQAHAAALLSGTRLP
jgi:hypothetical protein